MDIRIKSKDVKGERSADDRDPCSPFHRPLNRETEDTQRGNSCQVPTARAVVHMPGLVFSL